MQLISVLASGVIGAGSGTARLYRRGTSTLATWYDGYTGTGAHDDIINLDANGGAVAYVNQAVDVQVYSSDGESVRAFTVGLAAPNVEVISPSFTGVDYVTGEAAANKPTTLQSVLDRLITSFGSTNFNVLLDGVSTPVSVALSGLTGFFFNVAGYGAVGDAATDDSESIQAAVDAAEAAGGGVVLFESGFYRVSQTIVVPGGVNLLGIGPDACAIFLSDDTVEKLLALSGPGAFEMYQTVTGLKFYHSEDSAESLVSVEDAKVQFENCIFGDGSHSQGILLDVAEDAYPYDVLLKSCKFNVINNRAISTTAGTALECVLRIDQCSFLPSSSFSGQILIQSRCSLFCSNSEFYFGALNSGPSICFYFDEHCTVTGCWFQDPGGSASLQIFASGGTGAGDTLVESGNTLGQGTNAANVSPYTLTVGQLDQSRLDSRAGNWLIADDDAASHTVRSNDYGVYMVYRNAAGAQTLNFNSAPVGSRLKLILWCDAPSGSITFTWGTGVIAAAATQAVAEDRARVVSMVSMLMGATVVWLIENIGSELVIP